MLNFLTTSQKRITVSDARTILKEHPLSAEGVIGTYVREAKMEVRANRTTRTPLILLLAHRWIILMDPATQNPIPAIIRALSRFHLYQICDTWVANIDDTSIANVLSEHVEETLDTISHTDLNALRSLWPPAN